MERVWNSCSSSVHYVVSGIENSMPSRDPSDALQYGMMYSSLAHSSPYSRNKSNSVSSGGTSYIPCNFPSTPLPCSGSCAFSNFRPDTRPDCNKVQDISTSSLRSVQTSDIGCKNGRIPFSPEPHEDTSFSSDKCSRSKAAYLKSSTENDEQWVRPLGFAEKFMTLSGNWGNMSTVYALWLDSRGPIAFESIKRTSYLMLRKMPHLSLCVGYKKKRKWWKQMNPTRLDVEEIQSDQDPLIIYQSLLKRRYDVQEGPLWFVRFLTSVNRNDLVIDANSNPKHKYIIILGFHHNISDGTTNMKFCNIFISLLNDILQNKAVDLREEGRFASPIHDELAYGMFSYSFLIRLFALRLYKSLVAYCAYVKNFIKYYPMPYEEEGCTLVLQNEFDEITTQRLLKRCKMEGITLNSAFTAAANIGMYRMILERDGSVEKTQFGSQQTINMRRYWPKDKQKNAYGCHISMVDIQIPTEKDDILNFWEYARRVHNTIYEELNVEKRIIKLQPLSEKLCLAILINSFLSKFRYPSTNDSHYCITNMGNVSSIFPGVGNEVNVTKMTRSVTCHFMQSLCQHTLQTFKGKFYYSLDYYPQKMSVDTARAYASSLMDTLRTSIHRPN